jgi:pimeloyl-ACP methyl ester carboxylesterase
MFMILPLVFLLCFTFSCQKAEEVAEEVEQIETASYALNKGIRIHFEIEGSGQPLILQHGLSNSLEYWRDFGYTKILKKYYKLILIDARGHGKSDVPKDPEVYDTSIMAKDIIAVLDHLNIDKAHYLGYSMGGYIGFDLAERYSERFYTLIIGGAQPYPEDFSDARKLVEAGTSVTSVILDFWDSVSAPLKQETRRQLLEHNPIPIRALFAKDRPDMSHILSSMKMPCLVYVGEDDVPKFKKAKECVKHMTNGTFVSFPGLDHFEAQVRSDLVLPHIMKFLADNSH